MHRSIAREIIVAMSGPGDVVLDPFTGSGTVPVEAMVAGRRAIGIDMSPLAIRIAEVKTRRTSDAERERFAETASAVAERSTARVRARTSSTWATRRNSSGGAFPRSGLAGTS